MAAPPPGPCLPVNTTSMHGTVDAAPNAALEEVHDVLGQRARLSVRGMPGTETNAGDGEECRGRRGMPGTETNLVRKDIVDLPELFIQRGGSTVNKTGRGGGGVRQ
jgi:hypothetical protein